MTDDIVILDVENSDILVFENSDPPDVIDGQDEVFIVSVGEQGPAGFGIPAGGTQGQVATKGSGTTIVWADPAASLPTGGTAGQILTKQSSTDGDALWETPAATGATSADKATLMAFAAAYG